MNNLLWRFRRELLTNSFLVQLKPFQPVEMVNPTEPVRAPTRLPLENEHPRVYRALTRNPWLSKETSRALEAKLSRPERLKPFTPLNSKHSRVASQNKIGLILQGRINIVVSEQRGARTYESALRLGEGQWFGALELLRAYIMSSLAWTPTPGEPAPPSYKELLPPGCVRVQEDFSVFEERVRYEPVSLPNSQETSVRWLSLVDGLELMKGYPDFRRFVHFLVTVLWLPKGQVWGQIVGDNPLLGVLEPMDRGFLLQMACFQTFQGSEAEPFLAAGARPGRTFLLLEPGGQIHMPQRQREAGDSSASLVVDLGRGDLIGAETLLLKEEAEGKQAPDKRREELSGQPGRQTDVFVTEDTTTLAWDWDLLRGMLVENEAYLKELKEYLKRGEGRAWNISGHVFVFLSNDPERLDPSLLGYGAAIALARDVFDPSGQEGREEELNAFDRETIVFFDVEKPVGLLKLLGLSNGTFSKQAFDGLEYIVATHPKTERKDPNDSVWDGSNLKVVWPCGSERADHRSDEGIARQLVQLIHKTNIGSDVLHTFLTNRTLANAWLDRHAQSDGTTAVWFTNDPRQPYPTHQGPGTLPRPKHLFQANRITEEWRDTTPQHALVSELPLVEHTLRILHYPKNLHIPLHHRDETAVPPHITALNAYLEKSDGLLAKTFLRLSRMIRGRSVGLALGGGGPFGLSHIALIRHLEQVGMPVDYVAGTSFGSVVGAVFAGGYAGHLKGGHKDIFDALLKAIKPHHTTMLPKALRLLRRKENPSAKPGLFGDIVQALSSRGTRYAALSVLDSARLKEFVDEVMETAMDKPPTLSTTEIPFFPVSTDALKGEPAVAIKGSLGYGAWSSSCLPPLYAALPDPSGKTRYLDGAPVANVPAKVLRAMGADFIIGCNVIPPMPGRSSEPNTFSALIERGTDLYRSAFLAFWKVGDDEAQLASNCVVNLRPIGYNLHTFWKADRIVDAFDREVEKQFLAEKLVHIWKDGGWAQDSIPYKFVVELP